MGILRDYPVPAERGSFSIFTFFFWYFGLINTGRKPNYGR